MKDYLKESCSNEKIKLIYTNNKITVLSFSLNKNIPIIRAHRLFMNSPKKICNAIINYYTFRGNQQESLKLIEEYIKGFPKFKIYKILHPDDSFRTYFMDKTNNRQNIKISPVEVNISKLTQKSFRDNASFETRDNSINVSEDDVIEVDIVISPFNT